MKYALEEVREIKSKEDSLLQTKILAIKDDIVKYKEDQLRLCRESQERVLDNEKKVDLEQRAEVAGLKWKELEDLSGKLSEANRKLDVIRVKIEQGRETKNNVILKISELTKKNQVRRAVLVRELFTIYPLAESKIGWTISGFYVSKNNAILFEDDVSIALGNVTHAVRILTSLFNIPLRYAIYPLSSRSFVRDDQSPEKPMFPLFFGSGHDRAKFMRGITLLNQNILHMLKEIGSGDEIDEKSEDPIYILQNLSIFVACTQ